MDFPSFLSSRASCLKISLGLSYGFKWWNVGVWITESAEMATAGWMNWVYMLKRFLEVHLSFNYLTFNSATIRYSKHRAGAEDTMLSFYVINSWFTMLYWFLLYSVIQLYMHTCTHIYVNVYIYICILFLYSFPLWFVLVAQSSPTLCDPMGCSLPGSTIHGILQTIILEVIVFPSSRGSSQPRDRTQVSWY